MNGYFDLNPQTYDFCVRLFDRAKKLLGVRIMMHHDAHQLEQGDIFLFNHFARAETFIPQFCIFQETGARCRSIAAGEFFNGNERLTNLLRDLGAVPHDHPNLMSLLAIDILKGRKIIIFPEGGMVKDRQVFDDNGDFSVYSRSAGNRRKHHTGAARLATGLQIFKQAVLHKAQRSQRRELEVWAEQLGLPSVDLLLERARRPVTVVPANITFYPLRAQDNFLRRGADLLFGELSPRAIEELIVEGNLFFKATDMDIRCGAPIQPGLGWQWWERLVAAYMARSVPDLDAIFTHDYLQETTVRKIAAKGLHASIEGLRDRYMCDIYREVTVNLSHLAACVILKIVEQGKQEFSVRALSRSLYLALKRLQPQTAVHLHRSLINPDIYRQLLDAKSTALEDFLAGAATAELITREGDLVHCLPKLLEAPDFDQIRLENPLEVYANEVAPLHEVGAVVTAALAESATLTPRALAELAFADEVIAVDWDKRLFSKDKHRAINAEETATADPAPFLLLPARPRALGVLLVHGFLAGPEEVRPFGDKVFAAGYPVLGVRLKGHGTSPWDLRERTWRDWWTSVTNGYDILRAYCARICIVGFSTGGALTLLTAAQQPPGLAGIIAIAPPIKFKNRNMRFVPLVHGANQLFEWVSNQEGIVPFRPTEPEHPNINYQHMPIRGLYELTRMVSELKKSLGDVQCPTLVLQGTADPVVDPESAEIVHAKLGSADKQLNWIEATRHGILYDDIGETQQRALAFLARLEAHDAAGLATGEA